MTAIDMALSNIEVIWRHLAENRTCRVIAGEWLTVVVMGQIWLHIASYSKSMCRVISKRKCWFWVILHTHNMPWMLSWNWASSNHYTWWQRIHCAPSWLLHPYWTVFDKSFLSDFGSFLLKGIRVWHNINVQLESVDWIASVGNRSCKRSTQQLKRQRQTLLGSGLFIFFLTRYSITVHVFTLECIAAPNILPAHVDTREYVRQVPHQWLDEQKICIGVHLVLWHYVFFWGWPSELCPLIPSTVLMISPFGFLCHNEIIWGHWRWLQVLWMICLFQIFWIFRTLCTFTQTLFVAGYTQKRLASAIARLKAFLVISWI
jgi:hypothetical protein